MLQESPETASELRNEGYFFIPIFNFARPAVAWQSIELIPLSYILLKQEVYY